MSGSGGGGGYEYQARVAAFVSTHILAQQPLHWIEHSCSDTPATVLQETLGPGDDIQVVLHDQTLIEIQVKHGLKKSKLWEAVIPLAQGLIRSPLMYGVLVTDSTASKTIGDTLCRDLKRLGQGREDDLKPITQEFLHKLRENRLDYNAELFRRLRIIVIDLDDESQGAIIGQTHLCQVVPQPQIKQAWAVLVKDCFSMITERGQRDSLILLRLLSSHNIQLSTNAENSILSFEKYRTYLTEKTAQFTVPALRKFLSIQQDWLPLQTKCIQGDPEPFKADLLPLLYSLTLVIGHSGSGKSILLRRLANDLTTLNKRVLLVRLPDVLRLWRSQSGRTFNDAVLDVATDGLNFESSHLRSVLNTPDYLLADGLDECEQDRAAIAEQIITWAKGHSGTRIVLTNRIGYELEFAKEWILVKLQPLSTDEIQKYGTRLIAASTDQSTVGKHLTSWERCIEDKNIRSLVVNSPLLLGFVLQLLKLDIAINQTSRTALYKAIIDLACENLTPYRGAIRLSKRSAGRILELSGSKLLQHPSVTEDELIEYLIQTLKERDFSEQRAEYEAEQGIAFWKAQCLFDGVRIGHQKVITFAHPSLCEYAAGQYLSRLSHENLKVWLEKVRRDPRWRQAICFAAGLGAGETIVQHLLNLDQPDDFTSEEKTLAVITCAEADTISSDTLAEVVRRIQPQLESSSSEVIFGATQALLSISAKSQSLIAELSIPLLTHSYLHTRITALRLALACNPDSIPCIALKAILEQTLGEKVIPDFPFISGGVRRCRGIEWEIRNQTIFHGCELLLQQNSSPETANQILQWLSGGCLSSGTDQKIRKMLLDHTFAALRSSDELNRAAWNTFLPKLTQSQKLLEDLLNPQQTLREINRLECTKQADKAFLEAILRIAEEAGILPQTPERLQPLICLGILFKAMGWWEMPTNEWDKLSERQDIVCVDMVLRATINVLNLDLQILSTEATWALEHINRFFAFDLTVIKAHLQAGQRNEGYLEALEEWYAIRDDEYASFVLYHHLPKVPVVFHWERAAQSQLSPIILARAIEHPSIGIRQTAAFLIEHGAGGAEAVSLLQQLQELDLEED
jgi:hypothetical protein